jgi:hypothetical protein
MSSVPGEPRWTALSVIDQAAKDFVASPAVLGVGLYLLPVLWELPSWVLGQHLGQRFPKTLSIVGVALWVAGAAWGSLLTGGRIDLALSAADGHAPDLGAFLRGMRHYLSMFLSTLALNSLLALRSVLVPLPGHGSAKTLALLPVLVISLVLGEYLRFRSCLWQTILVDQRSSLVASLQRSWRLTRDRVWQLAAFDYLLFAPAALGLALLFIATFSTFRHGGAGFMADGWKRLLGFQLVFNGLLLPSFLLNPIGFARIYRTESESLAPT